MKHIYSLAALLFFMLPASAQQEERVITEEPLCLVSTDSVWAVWCAVPVL